MTHPIVRIQPPPAPEGRGIGLVAGGGRSEAEKGETRPSVMAPAGATDREWSLSCAQASHCPMDRSCRVLPSGAVLVLTVLLAGCGINVPSVVGRKLPVAEERLQRAGLKSVTRREQVADAPSGEVISQDPKAGTSVKKDSVVSLVVAEGATLTGSFTLIDTEISRTSEGCTGTGGYTDVREGLQVVVKNEKNEILALGQLGRDNYTGEYPQVACEFPFVIKDIPRADFYEIEVGKRGSLKYSVDDLRKAGWVVEFSLGGS